MNITPGIAIAVLLWTGVPQSHDVEQTTPGTRPPAVIAASFDGLGAGFDGPQGHYEGRNPSDNSVAVGPDHVVQIVNTRFAVFTKAGKPLYGPVPTNAFFTGLGGPCEARNNGDAVARYDQLAKRWLIVMPIFSRIPLSEIEGRPPVNEPARPGQLAAEGQAH